MTTYFVFTLKALAARRASISMKGTSHDYDTRARNRILLPRRSSMTQLAKRPKSKSRRKFKSRERRSQSSVHLAMVAAREASNGACILCGRSEAKDRISTKCYMIELHPLRIDVLCQECRERQLAKALTIDNWVGEPRVVREADPNCTESAPF